MNHAKCFPRFILLFCTIWRWIACRIGSCFTFLFCAMWLWISIVWLFGEILQLLLLHLGADKRLCSLMRKISLYDLLPGWKTIKFPLIWYIIHIYLFNIYINNFNLKRRLLSFVAECTCMTRLIAKRLKSI